MNNSGLPIAFQRRNKVSIFVTWFVLWFGLVQTSIADSPNEKLKVVATFSILADFVKQIGGDSVDVHTLVDWGEDAHVFRPKPVDIKNITQADLLVANGLGYEGWLDRLLLSSSFHGKYLIATEGVNVISEQGAGAGGHEAEAHHGRKDPHAWLSFSAAKFYIKNILTALLELDPRNSAYYESNAQHYLLQLNALEKKAHVLMSRVPSTQRKLVVPHNAFAYLGREYDFQIIGLQGLSTEGEASAAQIAQIIRQIKEYKIQTVFLENIGNSRLINQLKNETGAIIAGELISGALSRSIAPTYLKMMEHNVFIIAQALGPK